MTYFDYFNFEPPMGKLLRDVREKKQIKLVLKNSKIFVNYQMDNFLIRDTAARGLAHTVELFVTASMTDSPKLHKIRQDDCEAMSQTKIDIPISQYNQPFPTMLIQFPDKYSKRKFVKNEGFTVKHSPKFVAVHFDFEQKLIAMVVYFSSNHCISKLYWEVDHIHKVEDILQTSGRVYEDSLGMSKDEWFAAIEAMRIALNCCSYLHRYGCRKLGPQNPGQFAKLTRYITTIKNPNLLEQLKLNLQLLPILYDFAEERNFYHVTKDKGMASLRSYWVPGCVQNNMVCLPTLVNPPERN